MKWHGMLACEQFHFSWCLLYKKLIRTKLLWAREHQCSSVCVWVENGSRKEYAFIYVLVTYCTAWAAGTIPVWRCRSYITTVFIKKCFNTDSFLAPVWLFVGEKNFFYFYCDLQDLTPMGTTCTPKQILTEQRNGSSWWTKLTRVMRGQWSSRTNILESSWLFRRAALWDCRPILKSASGFWISVCVW